MEYISEFLDNYKLEQYIKSNVISEVYRAVKVVVVLGLPVNTLLTDKDGVVDIHLNDVPYNYGIFLSELEYLFEHVKIDPVSVDNLVCFIIENRMDNCDFNKEDLKFLIAILNQITLKHKMEFSKRINEIFECLMKQNLFSSHVDWKQMIYHSLLPYFLKPYNEDRLKKLLDFNKLDIVCALHEYFISTDVHISGLWSQIQTALRQSHQKKNALFLLKRRLQLANASEDDSLFRSPTSIQYKNLIQLLEVSDAKQLHLLQPSMHLLKNLNELHMSWQITAWVVYLTHPHLAVVEVTLCSLLEESWWLRDNETFGQIIPVVLRGVNLCGGKIDFKICGSLFKRLGEQQMLITIKHCDNVTWTPTSFYYFYKEYLPYMTLDSHSILSLLNHLQTLPDKSVRDTFMELYFKPKILQYISYDKNCERAIKIVFYGVFLYYYNGDTIHWFDLAYRAIIRECLSQSYNFETLYQVTTVTYSYLKFLIYLQIDLQSPKEFTFLSHRYLLETFGEEIVNKFGLETLHQAMVATEQSIKNSEEIYSSLEATLLDDTISFTNRSVALQIYTCLTRFWANPEYESILEVWTEILLSGDYKFDESTCKAFLKLPMLLSDQIDICNTILNTQTDTVVVTLFEYLTDDVEVSILEQCFKKLIDMTRSSYFKKACDVLFDKLSPTCYSVLVQMRGFDVLFNENLHVRYIVTKKWANMDNNEISGYKQLLKLTFDCLFADTVRSKKEMMDFKIMMELIGSTYDSKYEKHLCQWHCYKSQAIVLNAMTVCHKFKAPIVLDFCKAHLDKIFQKRYYIDSQIHIEKIRIYQLLVMVYLNDCKVVDGESRFPVVFKYLCEESNQNDVKQFQMLLLTNLKFYSKLLHFLNTNYTIRTTRGTNALISVIIILHHIVRYYGNQQLCADVITTLITYSMGANFKVRLVSQVSISYLLQYAEKKNWTNLVEKHENMQNALKLMITDINWSSDLQYLVYFNPNEYYTADSILIDIPRLNNVCENEWRLNSHLFKGMLRNKMRFCDLKFYNTGRKYSNLSGLVSKKEMFERKTISSNMQVDNIVQRKPHSKTDESSYEGDHFNPQINSGLIMIGSLVDSAANLGGLARTCHILGATTLIIDDFHATESLDFQSLSMSAERWLDIQEVKAAKLEAYLIKMREEGYAIIGAEQTNQSVLLSSHPFQFRTALLLGNERTGIPANILTMLDTCVEIPQFGVVRSLNVHVAAAIIVYEYSQKNRNCIK